VLPLVKFPSHPTLDLNGAWSLILSEQPISIRSLADAEVNGLRLLPATVPGNLELDLQAAGQFDELFHGMNIAAVQKLENHSIGYGRHFHASPRPGHEAFLRFEGLDCQAEIFLNGRRVGESDNALIEHEFPIEDHLLKGENEIFIHIRPAVLEAKKYAYPPGVGANRSNYESLYLRKPPHCFGWDIMPRALSAGLWRPVSLVFRPVERIDTLFLQTLSVQEQAARHALHYRTRTTDASAVYEIEIEGVCGSSSFKERQRLLFEAGRLVFNLLQPTRWWPRGRGAPALYDIIVRLLKNGAIIDQAQWRHGIRSVELERTSTTDSAGRGEFCFRVNGEKVFVLGTNWVPADAFHSRDVARIPQLLALAEEIGCNTIRCWGGNVYENDLFFDLCDEKGFLVWQDFALGCAVYPQDMAFQERVADEARSVVRRLREHASLALWAGDNECDQAYGWYGAGNPNANVLTRRVLPDVVRSEDPTRTYLPSSPIIDETAYAAGEQFLPENHLWGPRDGFKSDYYKNALCHFASEIGYHGCPAPDSVRRFISPDKLWPPGNDEWLLHASSPVPGVDIHDYRIEVMTKQVYEFFGVKADNLEDYAFLSQCVQAEAFKFFIEWFRTAKWRRTGIIWWNLCDGWPQFADSVVDYYFEKKLAFDFIRRSQQPLCLMFREAANWQHELVACNDTRHDVSLHYSVRDATTDAVVCQGHAIARADAVTVLNAIPIFTADKRLFIIEWHADKLRGINHYLAGMPPFAPAAYGEWLRQAGFSVPWRPIVARTE
jgi:beta-mannosidase